MPVILPIGPDFRRWNELLDLIRTSFAFMDGIVDPPSSAHRLTALGLAEKSAKETGFVAECGERIVGCVYAAEQAQQIYVGKLAIHPDWQGRGIGKLLIKRVEQFALAAGKPLLQLQVRLELASNQAAFARMGFKEVARTAHPGFERPTSITMQKSLA